MSPTWSCAKPAQGSSMSSGPDELPALRSSMVTTWKWRLNTSGALKAVRCQNAVVAFKPPGGSNSNGKPLPRCSYQMEVSAGMLM